MNSGSDKPFWGGSFRFLIDDEGGGKYHQTVRTVRAPLAQGNAQR